MVLSRPVKVVVGLLTAWPILYAGLFFIFMVWMVAWISRTSGPGGDQSSSLPGPAMLMFVVHFLTILLVFGLMAFYLVYLFKTKRVPENTKALWAVGVIVGGVVAMPAFFYLYVWPDQWPSDSAPRA